VIVQGTSVGLDVHTLSVVAHAVDEETGKIARARLCPDHGEVLGWLHQLRAPVRVTYEAGPTGFGLARAITEAGMECVVAAPSKLQRPAGDRIKTDLLTPVMPRIWPGCCASVRSPWYGCPIVRSKRCGIWCGLVKMPARI
jgi:hypothetical protein